MVYCTSLGHCVADTVYIVSDVMEMALYL